MFVVLSVEGATAAAPPPAIPGDWPDPIVVEDGGTFYSYSTNVFPFGFTINVPLATSSDLATWTYVGDALPALGSWAVPGRTWAPEVERLGANWSLYYSARHQASDRQCIGHAIASSPTGPFVDPHDGPLICQPDRGGSIDPAVFVEGGVPTIVWKSEDETVGGVAHLWSAPLAPDGATLAGAPVDLLAASGAWQRRTIEGPALVRSADGILLFYSGGSFGTAEYSTGFARCATAAGPCIDQTVGSPWVSTTNTGIVGPGGASVLERSDGSLVMTLHGWVGAVGYPSGARAMYVQPLDLSGSSPHIPAITAVGNRYLRSAPSSGVADIVLSYGQPGDLQLACDWDGDDIDTPGVVRDGTWYLRQSNSSGVADVVFAYGNHDDTPVCGDWNGDGTDTPGVFRSGVWYLRNANSTGVADTVVGYGNPSDLPVVGDWDGDGASTPGIVRRGSWYLRNSTTTGVADTTFTYGDPSDLVVPGDWDGNGTDTPGIFRSGSWHIRNSNTTGVAEVAFRFGDPGDQPLAGDWSGSGADGPGLTR